MMMMMTMTTIITTRIMTVMIIMRMITVTKTVSSSGCENPCHRKRHGQEELQLSGKLSTVRAGEQKVEQRPSRRLPSSCNYIPDLPLPDNPSEKKPRQDCPTQPSVAALGQCEAAASGDFPASSSSQWDRGARVRARI